MPTDEQIEAATKAIGNRWVIASQLGLNRRLSDFFDTGSLRAIAHAALEAAEKEKDK